MKFREPLFRPPAEANSLIFQVAYGCPHNACRFCAMYKGVRYEKRPFAELAAEFAEAAAVMLDTRRVFLADGDAMALDFDILEQILLELNRLFPRLARVNLYANGSSILAKSAAELDRLKKLKLNTLYLGLESGCQRLLDLVTKHETATGMAEAIQTAQHAGLKCSVMVLLGLGGKKYSAGHAAETAEILNLAKPKLLSALRFVEVPGTSMFQGYQPLTEVDVVRELRDMLAALDFETVFTANHTSNPIPLKGRLPRDKNKLLDTLDTMIKSGALDAGGPGHIPLWL